MLKFITEVQEKGDLSLFDQIVHPDFYDHAHDDNQPRDREAGRAVLRAIHAGLSDIKVEVIHCICTDAVVATNKVIRGKLTGELFGKPATGGTVEMRVMDFVRFENGMFREHWANAGQMRSV